MQSYCIVYKDISCWPSPSQVSAYDGESKTSLELVIKEKVNPNPIQRI